MLPAILPNKKTLVAKKKKISHSSRYYYDRVKPFCAVYYCLCFSICVYPNNQTYFFTEHSDGKIPPPRHRHWLRASTWMHHNEKLEEATYNIWWTFCQESGPLFFLQLFIFFGFFLGLLSWCTDMVQLKRLTCGDLMSDKLWHTAGGVWRW